ncbi:MAG TPA: PIG-L deacetylase family protein [Steroidobacteraceae bacterium]|nr:PIG-L deacetylase family protein [Steroidobacteraceae bacterium]
MGKSSRAAISSAARHGDVGEESGWTQLLAHCPAWSPEEGDLLVVAPHPDDEVLGAGGLIRTWAARGAKVSVLSVSDGEAANPAREALASVRREELNEALRRLCPTHVSVTRLGLPDGKVGQHSNRVRNALLSLASGRLTLIAPYEHDAHPDHEAVGGVCHEFARARQIPLARYAIHAWRHAAPQAFRDARWGKFVLREDARRAKARALQCFRSQAAPRRGAPADGPGRFDRPYEAFLL